MSTVSCWPEFRPCGARTWALRGEVRLLREEPSRLEELARRELGLIRPGERLFIVPTEPPAMQAAESPHAEQRPDLERGPQDRGS